MKKKKQKNKYKRLSKLCFVFSIIGIAIWGALFAANNVVSKDTLSAISESIAGSTEAKKEEITFLVAGTNENLTDTIIYGKYNTTENKLYMMSVPRDTYTTNEVCVGHKINAIYRGKNLDAFLNEIKELLDVDIDYYAIFDSSFVKEVVDAVGGVEIYVPQRMYYSGGNPRIVIDLQEGTQVLNGEKAEQFLRFRSGYANADLGRVEAQRSFIKAFIKTVLKKENITNIPKIVKIALDNTKTNATTREILKYANEIKEINIDEIVSTTMPNTPKYIDGISYVIADKDEARRIIKEDWNSSIASEINEENE